MAAAVADLQGGQPDSETSRPLLTKRIFSIGHSSNEADAFVRLLQKFNVKELVDVRSIPSSGKFPHFKRSALQQLCQRRGIAYRHCPQLGNKGVDGGILALLATEEGSTALAKLATSAMEATLLGPKTAMMCAEADWRDCHRQVVAQRLLEDFGIVVAHIKKDGSLEDHPQDHVLPSYFGAKRAVTAAPRFASAYSAEALCCPDPSTHLAGGYEDAGPVLLPGPPKPRDAPQLPEAPPMPAATSEADAKPKRRWGRVTPSER